jgi:hypothetical protein
MNFQNPVKYGIFYVNFLDKYHIKLVKNLICKLQVNSSSGFHLRSVQTVNKTQNNDFNNKQQ